MSKSYVAWGRITELSDDDAAVIADTVRLPFDEQAALREWAEIGDRADISPALHSFVTDLLREGAQGVAARVRADAERRHHIQDRAPTDEAVQRLIRGLQLPEVRVALRADPEHEVLRRMLEMTEDVLVGLAEGGARDTD